MSIDLLFFSCCCCPAAPALVVCAVKRLPRNGSLFTGLFNRKTSSVTFCIIYTTNQLFEWLHYTRLCLVFYVPIHCIKLLIHCDALSSGSRMLCSGCGLVWWAVLPANVDGGLVCYDSAWFRSPDDCNFSQEFQNYKSQLTSHACCCCLAITHA